MTFEWTRTHFGRCGVWTHDVCREAKFSSTQPLPSTAGHITNTSATNTLANHQQQQWPSSRGQQPATSQAHRSQHSTAHIPCRSTTHSTAPHTTHLRSPPRGVHVVGTGTPPGCRQVPPHTAVSVCWTVWTPSGPASRAGPTCQAGCGGWRRTIAPLVPPVRMVTCRQYTRLGPVLHLDSSSEVTDALHCAVAFDWVISKCSA